jgi:CHAT domain-containing protein
MPKLAVAVLAGCDTGRGARNDSEGSWSIARAFLIAGAPSAIATLWPIDDKDAPAMFSGLHNHLMSGRGPAEAAHDAQIEMLRGNQRGRPSIWAAIQVIGS